jgi:hypothetical protein
MDMSSWKIYRNQIAFGLTLSLVTIIALAILGIILVVPFSDFRFVIGLTIVGAVSLLVSLIRTDAKGQWSIFYWFGIVLLALACAGALWTLFVPNLSYIFTGVLTTLIGFILVFFPAIPLFNFISTKKPKPSMSIETTATPIET